MIYNSQGKVDFSKFLIDDKDTHFERKLIDKIFIEGN